MTVERMLGDPRVPTDTTAHSSASATDSGIATVAGRDAITGQKVLVIKVGLRRLVEPLIAIIAIVTLLAIYYRIDLLGLRSGRERRQQRAAASERCELGSRAACLESASLSLEDDNPSAALRDLRILCLDIHDACGCYDAGLLRYRLDRSTILFPTWSSEIREARRLSKESDPGDLYFACSPQILDVRLTPTLVEELRRERDE